jgi:hypothetical protein
MLTCVEKLINKKQGTRFKAQKRAAIKKVQVAGQKNKMIPTCTLNLEPCALIINQNFDWMRRRVSANGQIVLV